MSFISKSYVLLMITVVNATEYLRDTRENDFYEDFFQHNLYHTINTAQEKIKEQNSAKTIE